jgi:lactoylglutathione lyase
MTRLDKTAHPFASARLLHTMLRVRDLERSLRFYVDGLGMRVQRRQEFPEGQFTLAFVGYGPESAATVLELTYNWDDRDYDLGTAYGHVAIEVADLAAAVERLASAGTAITRAPGPLKGDPSQHIAFVRDPDGYAVELIARR